MGHAITRARIAALIALTVALAGLPGELRDGTLTADGKPTVRFLAAWQGGGFGALASDLVVVYRRALPGVAFQSIPGLTPAATLESIQAGSADLGFAFANGAYNAFVDGLHGQQPFDRLRAIANLGVTPIQFVVGPGISISGVQDLRGKRISAGVRGSNTERALSLLLPRYGIRPTDVHEEAMRPAEAADRLVAGTLDAMLVDTMYPADWITGVMAAGGRLISLTGAPVDQLRKDYWFYRLARIPAHAYPSQDEPVFTIGVESLLICRRDLDEHLVHDLTAAFFDALPKLSSARTALRFMDVDQAAAVPIPLHAGAARYYRERELQR
jgi:TRAP transporter TAXI family solute receptor